MLCHIYSDHCNFCHVCRPFRSVAVNTTVLAHFDAVWGGRQPPHLSRRCRSYGHFMRSIIWAGMLRQSDRSEEHTSELQSLMRISYAVFCLKKKKTYKNKYTTINITSSHNTQSTTL